MSGVIYDPIVFCTVLVIVSGCFGVTHPSHSLSITQILFNYLMKYIFPINAFIEIWIGWSIWPIRKNCEIISQIRQNILLIYLQIHQQNSYRISHRYSRTACWCYWRTGWLYIAIYHFVAISSYQRDFGVSRRVSRMIQMKGLKHIFSWDSLA